VLASTKSDANVQYAGRFVFSGSATLTRPYTTADDAYHGDSAAVYREIGPGVQIAVNTPGSAVIGDGSSGVVQALRGLLTHLQTNDVAGIGSDIGTLDAAHAAVVSARADIGARSNRLDAASARLSQLEETTSSLLSKIEDADMAKTLIDASTQQSVYESALRAGARIVQTSLLDFLQ
jgi:flagellar hook-associated protein 3 FlgL